MKVDMYKNKLTRFIGRQCYLLGAYSGDYNESCSQMYENIKKHGILSSFNCYYYNSGIFYWLHSRVNGYGKRITLKTVINRILNHR